MIVFGLLHIALSSLIAYFLSCLAGHLNASIAAISLISSVFLSYYILNYESSDFLNLRLNAWRKSSIGIFEKIVFALICFIGFRHFLFLFYRVDNEVRSLHQFNLGDLPLHIQYIRNLAMGVDFPPHNPNFPSELLRYPFGIDLYNALWEALGVVTSSHLFLVGIFCVLASLVSLRLAGSWLAMVAFFFSGGFISLSTGGALDVQRLLSWKNLFIAMFITQRGFVWALPAGILILYFLFLNARRDMPIKGGASAALHPRTLLIIGILWASLAFFHLHSFFIISLMIGLLGLYRWYEHRKAAPGAIKKYFLLWVWPASIGTYFVLISLNFFKMQSVAHWHWGWTLEPEQNFLQFISVNFGTYLLLFAGVGVIIFMNKKKNFYFEYLVNLGIFILFFNLILAPWDWDNVKVLVWPYLGLSILSFEILREFWTNWMQVVLLISLSYGGLYAISDSQFSVAHHILLYKTADIALAKAATKEILPNAVFASSTNYDHELTALGRNRVMGYEAHLWAHGIQAQDTKQKLVELMTGGEHWLERARELRVNYIYWGPREKKEFVPLENGSSSSGPSWRGQLKNVSHIADIEVYEVPL